MTRKSRYILGNACLAMAASAAAKTAEPPRTLPSGDVAIAFDRVDANPGIRMIEIRHGAGGRLSGVLTSDWYGEIPVTDAVRSRGGTVLSFSTRNINDPKNPTRRWTLTATPSAYELRGGIWETHIRQAGRKAAPADIRQLRFHPAPLPPFAAVPPDGLARTPPMGWSSWNRFADRIDDRTVRAMADAMVSSGLRDAGYRYVNIDDGWQGRRAADGSLRPNARFPDMKALADYVHSRGLKLGIYSSPGPRTCAGYEGSYGHVAQDARTFAGWGVDYLKYDLCSGEWFYADRDTVRRAYAEMGAALRATGRPILYSLCEYGRFSVGRWGRSVGGHLWRTTGDITDSYPVMARIGFETNGDPADAGPGGWNDPDMLEIGNGGMTADQYRSHMTLWAMSAAPLLMGHDLRRMSAADKAILENAAVIAIDQDPRGIQARAVRRQGTAETWVKPLADGRVAIALFNRGDTATRMTLTPRDAGWSRFAKIADIWAGHDVPAATDAIVVPPNGTVLLTATGT